MAERGKARGRGAPQPEAPEEGGARSRSGGLASDAGAAEVLRRVRTPADYEAVGGAPSGEAVDFASMLAFADVLPVMVAYIDRDFNYRFVNKPLAQWLERPRAEMLGKSMREVIGHKHFAMREPLLRAALAGERQFFASEFEHPTRGPLAVQTDYVP
jgi:PAS domain-containing protein